MKIIKLLKIPSACAVQTPRTDSSIPLSIMEGLLVIFTVENLDSNLPDMLLFNTTPCPSEMVYTVKSSKGGINCWGERMWTRAVQPFQAICRHDTLMIPLSSDINAAVPVADVKIDGSLGFTENRLWLFTFVTPSSMLFCKHFNRPIQTWFVQHVDACLLAVLPHLNFQIKAHFGGYFLKLPNYLSLI